MKSKTKIYDKFLDDSGYLPYTKLYKNVCIEYPDLFRTRNDFFDFLNELEILYHSKSERDGKITKRIQIYTKASKLGYAKVVLIDGFKSAVLTHKDIDFILREIENLPHQEELI